MPDLLVIVDMQNDFVTKGGALYFEKAEDVKPVVLDCVKNHVEKDENIIFTQDWHEKDDEEFKLFPPHCVKNTWGAELFDELKELVQGYDKAFFVRKKKFSAFYGTDLDEKLKELSPTKIEVCGVATNICVLFTVEELRNRGYEVILYENGVSSYDEKLHEFALSQMRDVLGAKIERWR